MANRRIEYDPSESSYYTEALSLLADYRSQANADDLAIAAGSADRAAHAAEQLADRALLRALTSQSERAVAAAMCLPRPTLQHRVKRARARLHGETADQDTED